MTVIPLVADMNHANPVDFAALKHSSCIGVIHKARQGVGFEDNAYHKRRDLAEAQGLLWGAYDFATEGDIKADVAAFIATANPDDHTSLWLDYERNKARTMSIAHALEFLDRVDQWLGRRCGIYGGDLIKSEIVHCTAAQREFLGQHPLWGCQYGPRWKNLDVNGHPLPWKEPLLWQYTGDGVGPLPHTLPGVRAGADLSTSSLTAEQLRAVWPGPSIVPHEDA
jgi:GH25 family lysozyme M1 (1,4-beta-N-acetylmuramidase)